MDLNKNTTLSKHNLKGIKRMNKRKMMKSVVSGGLVTTYEVQLTEKEYEDLRKKKFSEHLTSILKTYDLKQSELCADIMNEKGLEFRGFDPGAISNYKNGKKMPEYKTIGKLTRMLNRILRDKGKMKDDEINPDYLTLRSDYMTTSEAAAAKQKEMIASQHYSESSNWDMALCRRIMFEEINNIHCKLNYSDHTIESENGSSVPFNDVLERYQKEMTWYSKCILSRIIEEYSHSEEETQPDIDPLLRKAKLIE